MAKEKWVSAASKQKEGIKVGHIQKEIEAWFRGAKLKFDLIYGTFTRSIKNWTPDYFRMHMAIFLCTWPFSC